MQLVLPSILLILLPMLLAVKLNLYKGDMDLQVEDESGKNFKIRLPNLTQNWVSLKCDDEQCHANGTSGTYVDIIRDQSSIGKPYSVERGGVMKLKVRPGDYIYVIVSIFSSLTDVFNQQIHVMNAFMSFDRSSESSEDSGSDKDGVSSESRESKRFIPRLKREAIFSVAIFSVEAD
ncbi:hypothetical protein PSACC_01822 [Paramicrosporidium saccamoebae]|uniref:Uncharacterized protein n=1 Tax=Paramicrosporidium saccamoebae TaxID=1246581 RepID=A0A2H9TKT3_9FUNG|nr:hypothetical protein PSACC_01822 [Paramicrosporidium saccamoebae]